MIELGHPSRVGVVPPRAFEACTAMLPTKHRHKGSIMKELRGKSAVVTGGGGGIGRGIAHALAEEGVNVVVADIEPDSAETVAAELQQLGVRAVAVQTDVIDASAVDALAENAYEQFGEIHVLCNNAGVFAGGPIAETAVEDLDWMLAVNFDGTANGVRAFLPRMRAQDGEAHIVNTGSVSGLYPTPHQGAYSASKYAVVGYSERLQQELEPDGIGVSLLCPAGVRTRIGEARRNRQAQFGGPVVAPPRPPRGPDADRDPRWLDPMDVGKLVIQGIRRNRLYIHTDASWERLYRERFERILADFELLE